MDGKRAYVYEKLFDDKVASSKTFEYSGGDGAAGEKWRKVTRGYFIQKCPDLLPVLNWAESLDDEEVTREAVTAKQMDLEWMIELDVFELSRAVWGFLNICLSGAARDIFDDADLGDGLNAWRLLVYEFRSSAYVRTTQLRNAVKNVPKCTGLEQVSEHISRMERNIRDYVAIAGIERQPSPHDMKQDLLDSLPQEIREQLQWRITHTESYTAFRNFVKSTSYAILQQRGKIKSNINMVSPAPMLSTVSSGQELPVQNHQDEFSQEEIFAFMRRAMGGGSGKANARAPYHPRPGAPAAGDRGGGQGNRKCINCGSLAHLTKDCTAGEVPRDKRPCWKCGRPGHIAM